MEDATAQNPEQKKEKPLHELLTSSLVDVYVGASSTHWTLHEQLLRHYSPFFATKLHADDKEEERKQRGNKSYSLPDEDDDPFELLVGWLYSQSIRPPKVENDIGPLLELYLLAVKLEVEKLQSDVVETVRDYYHSTSTYPGLRRVQYIYSETDEDNEMREMMVSAVARQLTTSDKIAAHWATALQRNGQLAVDIIRAIQQWHIEERSIPDARDVSSHRGRRASEFGFSSIERVGNSTDTVDTNMGVESVNSGASDAPNIKSDAEEILSQTLNSRPPEARIDPPDKAERMSSSEPEEGRPLTEAKGERRATKENQTRWKAFQDGLKFICVSRTESIFLLSAWFVYLIYHIGAFGKGGTWS